MEPAEGEERRPDVWRLRLPAATDVTWSLGAGMEALLRRESGEAGAAAAATLGAGQPSKVALDAGDYRLEVQSTRRNNRAAYSLAAFPEALVPGMDRDVRAPAEVPLAVGASGLVEVSSLGQRRREGPPLRRAAGPSSPRATTAPTTGTSRSG